MSPEYEAATEIRDAVSALCDATERLALATEILALFHWEQVVAIMRRDDDRPSDVQRQAVKYLEARIQRHLPATRRTTGG